MVLVASLLQGEGKPHSRVGAVGVQIFIDSYVPARSPVVRSAAWKLPGRRLNLLAFSEILRRHEPASDGAGLGAAEHASKAP